MVKLSLAKIICHDLNRVIMILPPSLRYPKDGGFYEGKGENPMSIAKHCLCAFKYNYYCSDKHKILFRFTLYCSDVIYESL